MTESRLILPENVTPINYEVKLEPNFDTFTFNGKVIIKADVNQVTDTIVLNSAELEIQDVSVDCEGVKCTVLNVSIDPDNEIISIDLSKSLETGKSNLQVQMSEIRQNRTNNYIQENVGRVLKIPKQTPVKIQRQMSKATVNLFIATAEGKERLLVELLYCLGVRRDEIRKLKKKDISYSNRTLIFFCNWERE